MNEKLTLEMIAKMNDEELTNLMVCSAITSQEKWEEFLEAVKNENVLSIDLN